MALLIFNQSKHACRILKRPQMIEKIKDSDIEAAALVALAAQAFSGFDWAAADKRARVNQLRRWLKLEITYAPDSVDFDALARDALPLNNAEWGCQRQIDARNRFTEAVEAVLTRKQFEAYDSFCLKATTDEIIEEGLRLAKAATEQKEH
jgi:hypothetical protein